MPVKIAGNLFAEFGDPLGNGFARQQHFKFGMESPFYTRVRTAEKGLRLTRHLAALASPIARPSHATRECYFAAYPEEPVVNLKGIQLTWLGHATFRVETPEGKTLYIDPWIAGNPNVPGE